MTASGDGCCRGSGPRQNADCRDIRRGAPALVTSQLAGSYRSPARRLSQGGAVTRWLMSMSMSEWDRSGSESSIFLLYSRLGRVTQELYEFTMSTQQRALSEHCRIGSGSELLPAASSVPETLDGERAPTAAALGIALIVPPIACIYELEGHTAQTGREGVGEDWPSRPRSQKELGAEPFCLHRAVS